MQFVNILTGKTMTPEPWQLELKVGDFYINEKAVAALGEDIFYSTPNIYGQIVSDEDCRPGYFWVRGYSEWCPEGELGGFNICEATRKLTEDEFNQARENGWP